MTPNIPDFKGLIYHFTTAETAMFHILPSLRLKLSSFLESNDPKETRTFGFWSIYEGCTDDERSKIEIAFEEYLKRTCKHLCFSGNYIEIQNKTNYHRCGAIHPTLWAHYAGKSKGICFGIDKRQFIKDNPGIIFRKVKYSKILRFPLLDYQKWQVSQDDYFNDFLRKNSSSLFYQKHFHWECEDEIKCIVIGNKKYCTIENSLRYLFLGSEFNSELNKALSCLIPEDILVEKVDIDDGRLRTLPYHLD